MAETDLHARARHIARRMSRSTMVGAIADWFARVDQQQALPPALTVAADLQQALRYGENPHQAAALYIPAGTRERGIAQAEQLQGKELSYNNLNDANAALELVAEFRDGPPTVVIVKHANPCGVASAATLLEAYQAALACDSVSAFGGIIAVNRPLDAATAKAITGTMTLKSLRVSQTQHTHSRTGTVSHQMAGVPNR